MTNHIAAREPLDVLTSKLRRCLTRETSLCLCQLWRTGQYHPNQSEINIYGNDSNLRSEILTGATEEDDTPYTTLKIDPVYLEDRQHYVCRAVLKSAQVIPK